MGVTFGSPLVFGADVRSSLFYEKLRAQCLHFVYQLDLVPRLQNGMSMAYRRALLNGLLESALPINNLSMVFDVRQRVDFVLSKFQEHQWLLDGYASVGEFVLLFEREA